MSNRATTKSMFQWTDEDRIKVLTKALEVARRTPAQSLPQLFKAGQGVLSAEKRQVVTNFNLEKWLWFKDGIATGLAMVERRKKIATSQIVDKIRRSWEKSVQPKLMIAPAPVPQQPAAPQFPAWAELSQKDRFTLFDEGKPLSAPPPPSLVDIPLVPSVDIIPPAVDLVIFPTRYFLDGGSLVLTTFCTEVETSPFPPREPVQDELVVMLGLLIEAMENDRKQAGRDRQGLINLTKIIDHFDTRLANAQASINSLVNRLERGLVVASSPTLPLSRPLTRKPRVLVIGIVDREHQAIHIQNATKGHVEAIAFDLASGVAIPSTEEWDYVVVTKKAPPLWAAAARTMIPKDKYREAHGNAESIVKFIKSLPEVPIK